ncbi:hypothetical protein HBI56_200190 [Parastagonospora nodorum]|uniref:Uncharacterized protein n=2 Tax=Phaeosphaeria nodorum (strain SN15 / ATCC MYA-4574 / FGSC 10173) TaxID=321614 RepID=A0A7U2EW34_PHANO|nr:hypothetical protein SNOG_15695 [Parastagonospora nodorum SN15]KAH3905521.1 hypothetical protein HBH56_214730 [Parastagonospora nodorum]EAT77070.1 hypothetical protein SNOG_15695 [Parastagonospora nodorum SN15]KAH3922619.1 hypothetical protein HBH54_222770 [Parastagonospora nodorum]KAH3942127.1 hypothetical protein HBH53_192680 [Parastagonospora nodorum]KAH3961335.1 hypothetical protein HBH51_183420 [Parastagonospora nodorum]
MKTATTLFTLFASISTSHAVALSTVEPSIYPPGVLPSFTPGVIPGYTPGLGLPSNMPAPTDVPTFTLSPLPSASIPASASSGATTPMVPISSAASSLASLASSLASTNPPSSSTLAPTSTPQSTSARSTLGTRSSSATSQSTSIPPAPSAAGASGSLGGQGKERVWWVTFLLPLLVLA